MSKLIELDAAIAETWKDTGYSDPLNVMTAIRDRLEAMPTVDAVPVRHGRWEHHWDDHDDWLQCSECGYGDEGEVGMNQGTNFCPNCGADMRKDGDNGKAD